MWPFTLTKEDEAVTGQLEMTDIRRHKRTIEPDSHRELLDKARLVLEYNPAKDDVRLGNVLAELEIETLSRSQVEAYMRFRTVGKYEFVRYPIEKYRLAIPVHVINKAIQIKEHLPEAKFYIYNYERKGSMEGAGDPFLRVELDGWGWYIEVWDEPTFEGRTTK